MAAASNSREVEALSELRRKRNLALAIDWKSKFELRTMTEQGMVRDFALVSAATYADTNPGPYPEDSIKVLKTIILGKAVARGAWKIVNKCLNEWHIDPKDVSEVAHMLPIVIILILRGQEENVERWLGRFCNAETISQVDSDGNNALHIAALNNVPVIYTNYLIKKYPGLADRPNVRNHFKPIHYAIGDNLAALCKLEGAGAHINEIINDNTGITLLHRHIYSVPTMYDETTLNHLKNIRVLLRNKDTDVLKTVVSPEGNNLNALELLERNAQCRRLSRKVNYEIDVIKSLMRERMAAAKPRVARGSDASNVTTTSTATGASGGATAITFRTPENPRGSDEVAAYCSCSIM